MTIKLGLKNYKLYRFFAVLQVQLKKADHRIEF
jgi:hypothetical protein